MDQHVSLLDGHRRPQDGRRECIRIHPDVRERLRRLLYSPAFEGTGVGYSAFIDRACEAAETEYAVREGRA